MSRIMESRSLHDTRPTLFSLGLYQLAFVYTLTMQSLVYLYAILSFSASSYVTHAATVQVSPPSQPPSSDTIATVYPNFLGISLELSFINTYFGNSSDEVPTAMVNYLSAIRNRTLNKPVRLRLGGNSMDSSTYVPDQPDIVEFTNPNANSNDQPVNYGPALFDVMNAVNDKIGGTEYLIGLSLRQPNSTNIPLLAGDAQNALGDTLDAFLLGNEPDLYTRHGQRPNQNNYTVDNYTSDYFTVFTNLKTTHHGDILSLDKIAGPTICCAWDLDSLLRAGWLKTFKDRLKYITLQHYPQDNCQGTHKYELGYYLTHSETVELAQWQGPGLQYLSSAPGDMRKPLIMDEFSTASCGGVPDISDTFGATMWTVDYVLQMASVGYSAAYLHTRERGVTYNLFDPPNRPAGSAGDWTTNPSFYAYFPLAETLQATNGSKVVDLNIQDSATDKTATVAGYAIYDVLSSNVNRIVLFNFENKTSSTASFTLDPSFFSASSHASNVLIRYLAAPDVNEKKQISWGNLTFAGVGDGNVVQATFASAVADKNTDCSQGCTVDVPGPAVAVVFVGGEPSMVAQHDQISTHTPGKNDALSVYGLGLYHITVFPLLILALKLTYTFFLL